STSPLDRSHKSRPSQDRATTASRNDEVSEKNCRKNHLFAEETNRYRGDVHCKKNTPYITLWILAAPTRLTSMFLIFHIYCAGAISTFL
ncbi:unnamed protein product, partial [Brassica oleracea var. botrytis]